MLKKIVCSVKSRCWFQTLSVLYGEMIQFQEYVSICILSIRLVQPPPRNAVRMNTKQPQTTQVCLRLFFTFYHGISPLNHRFRQMWFYFFQASFPPNPMPPNQPKTPKEFWDSQVACCLLCHLLACFMHISGSGFLDPCRNMLPSKIDRTSYFLCQVPSSLRETDGEVVFCWKCSSYVLCQTFCRQKHAKKDPG